MEPLIYNSGEVFIVLVTTQKRMAKERAKREQEKKLNKMLGFRGRGRGRRGRGRGGRKK